MFSDILRQDRLIISHDSLQENHWYNLWWRPFIRYYGEKDTPEYKEHIENENWNNLYAEGTDWYDNFMNPTHAKFHKGFSLITLSRKRAKNKSCITMACEIV